MSSSPFALFSRVYKLLFPRSPPGGSVPSFFPINTKKGNSPLPLPRLRISAARLLVAPAYILLYVLHMKGALLADAHILFSPH